MVVESSFDRAALFGNLDGNLKLVEQHFSVEILQRENEILVKGERVPEAEAVIRQLIHMLETGEELDGQKINYVISLTENGLSYENNKLAREVICFTHMGKPIKAKTLGQRDYVLAISKRDVVFGVGPAGTGKTYLAVAKAVSAFKNKEVQKIILARPAVEAGERLGFLPGDLQEKVDPYLRPLYDALYEILGKESTLRLKEKDAIEIVPLAYMRGRTLDNSFIILDEAQNTTKEQMKMFLTRLGFGSKAVITGDITQIDLPKGRESGLVEAIKVLEGVKDIDFCYFTDIDVVRHPLVRSIINAYDAYYKRCAEENSDDSRDKDKGSLSDTGE